MHAQLQQLQHTLRRECVEEEVRCREQSLRNQALKEHMRQEQDVADLIQLLNTEPNQGAEESAAENIAPVSGSPNLDQFYGESTSASDDNVSENSASIMEST
eukprot:TRINITY_DN7576_c0_g1_i1.p1 TRINITY_DN7576_c0_g1~~TRINITY_DN7576_c0_g1_i1.p1  ORF type:complete len:102 (-),score=3.78 TRINITY_DN7576_c0_g1_i1:75-380(-)